MSGSHFFHNRQTRDRPPHSLAVGVMSSELRLYNHLFRTADGMIQLLSQSALADYSACPLPIAQIAFSQHLNFLTHFEASIERVVETRVSEITLRGRW